ncbi:MAG: N-acetylmuramoyl-L-alanine amidase [Bacteroidia bacterium]|nr:N-acetylmuramoyl-L-alanine amidase [Bacteroidia bacterium]MCZ2247845.1 N-acetylmuramoyl-L-alanine amidase [Bacteroidia bacterium]
MFKFRYSIFSIKVLLFFFLVCTAFSSYSPGKRIRVVVLNAGHGGNDPGCQGSKFLEKEVALAITLKLGKYIEDNIKEVKVLYTRKTDVFVPLDQIASHANKNNADLFICIHCNASVNKQVYGSETYVMGLHKTKGNLEVAKRENASILYEEDYKKKYEGFDPNSDEANIIFNMYQNAFLEHSLNFASKVQGEFKKNKNLTDKGVKQAGFLVLWKTSMPSVLIETGFLTNLEEEKYLGSQKGQDEIAYAIYRAFKNYKAEVEGYTPAPDNEKRQIVIDSPEKEKVASNQDSATNNNTANTPTVQASNAIVYRIQLMSSSKKIALNSSKFKGLSDIFEFQEDDTFKYFSGSYQTYEEAFEAQREVRKNNFPDAFTVAFVDGKKMSVKDAKALSEKK